VRGCKLNYIVTKTCRFGLRIQRVRYKFLSRFELTFVFTFVVETASRIFLEANRDKRNWMIHLLFLRQDYAECLKVINYMQPPSEYGLYAKALIKRYRGELHESLALFQRVAMLHPQSPQNLKQVGRSLYLVGRHKTAADIYEEAKKVAPSDWECYYGAGLCHAFAKDADRAVQNLTKANSIQRHECTYLELGKLYTMLGNYQKAVDVYLEALEFSPESVDLMSTLGLLFLHVGDTAKAVMHLGNALTLDARCARAIMGMGSVMQDGGDFDVALSKYRVAAVQTPYSSRMWNNIGMCFFGKKHFVAAVSCLKRSLHLAPLDWIVSYNLGLVALHMEQYVTAFHYFTACISLKDDFGPAFANLAVTLSRLGDFPAAFQAFRQALQLDVDVTTEINFAIAALNSGDVQFAAQALGVLRERQKGPQGKAWPPEVKKCLTDLETVVKQRIGERAAAGVGGGS
jgi:Bardet-Biedl syndrome 4 protein